MDFLNHIDFENHNGIYLPMINDVARNQFYDQILHEVKDCDCVEIGFGTGLLSMLALKHGARHITAYESDPYRFDLGRTMIKILNLSDKITLINQRYDHTCRHNAAVIFTETVDENIWGEGLYDSFPRHPGQRFLPGQYFLEVYAIPLSYEVALKMSQSYKKNYFSPGVDINPKFVSFVNLLLSKKYNQSLHTKTELPTGIIELPPNRSLLDFAINKTFVGRYVVDANTEFVDNPIREFRVDTFDQPVLIVPRAGMQHLGQRLSLDTSHWPMFKNPIIVNQPRSVITLSHNLRTGNMTYNIKDNI